jgi:hypothetical protein
VPALICLPLGQLTIFWLHLFCYGVCIAVVHCHLLSVVCRLEQLIAAYLSPIHVKVLSCGCSHLAPSFSVLVQLASTSISHPARALRGSISVVHEKEDFCNLSRRWLSTTTSHEAVKFICSLCQSAPTKHTLPGETRPPPESLPAGTVYCG